MHVQHVFNRATNGFPFTSMIITSFASSSHIRIHVLFSLFHGQADLQTIESSKSCLYLWVVVKLFLFIPPPALVSGIELMEPSSDVVGWSVRGLSWCTITISWGHLGGASLHGRTPDGALMSTSSCTRYSCGELVCWLSWRINSWGSLRGFLEFAIVPSLFPLML